MRATHLRLAAVVLAAGCGARSPSSTYLPTLESRLRADSSSVTARLELAAAYALAGEAARSIPLLEPVVRSDSSDAAAALYLGLGYEAAERYADARRLYERFLQLPAPGPLRRRIEERLDLLAQLELRSAVRASLAQEQALADASPPPMTVGVFPFLVAGDTALRPLGRAMAELLTTDLGQTTRLRVVERARVQMLLDEMQLGESRYTDAATAARTGRIVGAAHLVQGRVEAADRSIDVQALVVASTRPDSASDPFREQGALDRLFDMQNAIAFSVYERLGIQLTAAERERVNQRPTQNLQALLAFGFGLEARDEGRFAEAAEHFARAQQLDPGFGPAAELQISALQQSSAASFSPQQIAQQASGQLDLGLTPFQRQRLGLDVLETIIPTPLIRDPSVEVVGAEGIGRGPVIDIVIRRPGGAP